MKTAIIIPARWQSSRFPGKPLHLLAGKPLVRHVWERCRRSKEASLVIIATDDMRIAEACFDFGAEVSITSPRHTTGTDRIAEVARRLRGYKNIINVQGDEPLIEAGLIDRLITSLKERKIQMVTAACPFRRAIDATSPNNVKVVTDLQGNALYFSRSPIPYDRDHVSTNPFLLHLGIYGYKKEFLLQYVRWKPTSCENLEKLEQLRALEHGISIRVLKCRSQGIGVDTPEDARKVERMLKRIGKSAPKPQ